MPILQQDNANIAGLVLRLLHMHCKRLDAPGTPTSSNALQQSLQLEHIYRAAYASDVQIISKIVVPSTLAAAGDV